MAKEYLFYFRKQINTLVSVLRQQVKLTGFKYCPCCNHYSLFFLNKNYEKKTKKLCQKWGTGKEFTEQMVKRENNFCTHCLSNYRIRSHARTILKVFNQKKISDFISFLKKNPSFSIYETANYWVFRNRKIKKLKNYIVSEFHPNFPFGEKIKGIRNENLEKLTFQKQSFDLVITGEVLEHVADLSKSLTEIYRILKIGGYHIFTTPVNYSIKKTRLRATKSKNNSVKHLLPPILHGNDVASGILAFRDFGADIDKIVKNHGFSFREDKYYFDSQHITSVYISQKI